MFSLHPLLHPDFKPRLVRRDNEGNYILINGMIHYEEITILNIYMPSVSAPNHIKKRYWF
jgi:hypothetical protein